MTISLTSKVVKRAAAVVLVGVVLAGSSIAVRTEANLDKHTPAA